MRSWLTMVALAAALLATGCMAGEKPAPIEGEIKTAPGGAAANPKGEAPRPSID